jgi:hypothetical protein
LFELVRMVSALELEFRGGSDTQAPIPRMIAKLRIRFLRSMMIPMSLAAY